jgi:hypothetical protein
MAVVFETGAAIAWLRVPPSRGEGRLCLRGEGGRVRKGYRPRIAMAVVFEAAAAIAWHRVPPSRGEGGCVCVARRAVFERLAALVW